MKKIIDIISLILLIMGGINWGLIGLFNYNLIEILFGPGTSVTMFVYILVGVAALYYVLAYFIWRNTTSEAQHPLV